MRNFARDEDGFAGADAKSFFPDFKFYLAINEIDPFVLVTVEVARRSNIDLKNRHGAAGVLC